MGMSTSLSVATILSHRQQLFLNWMTLLKQSYQDPGNVAAVVQTAVVMTLMLQVQVLQHPHHVFPLTCGLLEEFLDVQPLVVNGWHLFLAGSALAGQHRLQVPITASGEEIPCVSQGLDTIPKPSLNHGPSIWPHGSTCHLFLLDSRELCAELGELWVTRWPHVGPKLIHLFPRLGVNQDEWVLDDFLRIHLRLLVTGGFKVQDHEAIK
mmetsp:Transcript_98313/g.120431  ORF Transcript_98313/g.120431 Transcript_98313/m.120431 type:complete len:209 (+) Transcript_98313:218-844(+)